MLLDFIPYQDVYIYNILFWHRHRLIWPSCFYNSAVVLLSYWVAGHGSLQKKILNQQFPLETIYMKTYKNRIAKVCPVCAEVPMQFPDCLTGVTSNFPHPRDALACFFFFLCSGSPETEFQVRLSWNEGTQNPNTGALPCVMCEHIFFSNSKKKIRTLEIGNKRILSGGLDSDTGPSPSGLLHHATVSLCPPSCRLFIHSALIFIEAKINFI